MDPQLRELKERISKQSDDELLQMVEVDFADYRKEAVDFAKSELLSRGISFDDDSAEDEPEENDEAELQKKLAGYSPEAIRRAQAMMAEREGSSGNRYEEADVNALPERDHSPAEEREIACPTCGSKTRYGMLLAESSVTITFTDNNEQRYVDAYACTKCGRVQLVMDLGTEIGE